MLVACAGVECRGLADSEEVWAQATNENFEESLEECDGREGISETHNLLLSDQSCEKAVGSVEKAHRTIPIPKALHHNQIDHHQHNQRP